MLAATNKCNYNKFISDDFDPKKLTNEGVLAKVPDLECFVCKYPYTEKEKAEAKFTLFSKGVLHDQPMLEVYCINCGNTVKTNGSQRTLHEPGILIH